MFNNAPSYSTEMIDSIFVFFLALSFIMLALITTLMVVFVVKYRRKRHPKPEHVPESTLLEVIWTAVPLLIVMGLFYWGWMGYRYLRIVPSDHMTVQVIASKWNWTFQYENGKQSTELHIPTGKPVKLLMNSRDVLHSFFVPAFRVKQDVVPGMETYLWFEADLEGTYDILCSEYCGDRHSYMLSAVVAQPPEEFQAWYQSRSQDPPGLHAIKTKGCISCHSLDGTRLVGPSLQGIFGRKGVVVTGGQEREITADEEYLRKSILNPLADIVKDYPPSMPPQRDLVTDAEIDQIVDYLKTLP